MNSRLRNILAVACLAISTQAAAEVTFYERDGFAGQSFSTSRPVGNFERYGFNDRASSVANAGRFVRTENFVVTALSCDLVSTRRWRQWA